MTVRLIVHADDFGLSEEVNAGIVEAWCRGIVTSTSVMPGGRAYRQAVDLIRRHPDMDVGVHLTLVEEMPVSPAADVRSLVSADGAFPPNAAAFGRRLLRGRVRRAEVRAELRRQIEMVLSEGITLTHLDSHQHVHMFPGVWSVVRDLAAEYTNGAVRYPRERVRRYMLRGGSGKRVAEMLALNACASVAGRKGLRTTDAFVGFHVGGRCDRANLRAVIDALPAGGTCELMCHPGKAPADDRYAHWGYAWASELAALTDPAVRDDLGRRGVTLTNYREL